MTKLYTAYGLKIKSDIDLPELLTISKMESVDITISEVKALSEPIFSKENEYLWESSATRFAQRIPNVAEYLVTYGKQIEIARLEDSSDIDVRLYLLGSIIGALLQQRGFLTLHASTIKTELGAVLFIGKSGAGKSTLLNALLQHGYSMMCDDVTPVKLSNKRLTTIAGFPRSRLWADSAAKLAHDTQTLERVGSDIEKYAIPVKNQFYNGEAPIQHIFILSSHNQDKILQKKQTLSESFEWLQQYTYRKRFVRGNALMKNQFEMVTTLSQKIPLTQFTRPEHLFLLDELVEKVIDTITS